MPMACPVGLRSRARLSNNQMGRSLPGLAQSSCTSTESRLFSQVAAVANMVTAAAKQFTRAALLPRVSDVGSIPIARSIRNPCVCKYILRLIAFCARSVLPNSGESQMNAPSNVPVVTIFVRHSAACKYKGDEFCRRCNCRKHLCWTAGGVQYRRSAKARTWVEAECQKQYLIEQMSAGKPPQLRQ